MRLNRDYLPLPGQQGFHSSSALVKYYCGALGAGKSSTLCVEGIALSVEFPGNVGVVARETLPELRMTTQARFMEYLPSDLIHDYNKQDRTLWIRSTGEKPSTVHFEPLDEVERFKSLDLGWWAVDEADKMTEEIFLMLIARLRHPGVRHSGMLASNPTSKHHWLYKRFFESADEDFALFRAKTKENEANLPHGYIERLVKAYPVDWRKRYIEGEPGTIMEGTAVFPDFREDFHVKGCAHKQGRTLLRGWDFGYHFPVCVFAEFDELGRLLILDSLFGKDEDLHSFAPRVIQKTNITYPQAKIQDYCDPSGIQKRDTGRGSIAILNQEFKIYPLYRWSKVEERAAEIRRLMREIIYREPAFQIHPLNRQAIDCLIGYQYRKDSDGLSSGEPDKDNVNDHFCFIAGTLIATPTGDVPIEKLLPGDAVLVPGGTATVLANSTRMDRVIQNAGLVGTPDHPIFSDTWETLSSLSKHPYSLTMVSWITSRLQKLLYGMERNTSASWTRTDITYALNQKTKIGRALRDCMWIFGNFILDGHVLKAMSFITKMATLLTTTFLTWSAYRLANIARGTHSCTIGDRALRKPEKPPRSGIVQMKVAHGIPFMVERLGRIGNPLNALAEYAGNALRLWPYVQLGLSTAPTIALSEPSLSNTEKQFSAWSAGIKKVFSNTRKRGLAPNAAPIFCESTKKAVVYNLKTTAGVYFANKILVSNCDALGYILANTTLTGTNPLLETPDTAILERGRFAKNRIKGAQWPRRSLH